MNAKNAQNKELLKIEKTKMPAIRGHILTGNLFMRRFPNEKYLFNKYFLDKLKVSGEKHGDSSIISRCSYQRG